MLQRTLEKVYKTVKENKGTPFKKLCEICGLHSHTVRKALKSLTKNGVISYLKLGTHKLYFTMHDLLMYYTKRERDQIYLNYLKRQKFGVNLNKISRELKMDKRSFKKEIQRLIKDGKVKEEQMGNMIVYKVKE